MMGDKPSNVHLKSAIKAIELKSESKLLESLSSLGDINVTEGVFKESLLHKAAKAKWKQGIQILLEKEAKIDAKNSYGQTSLHYSVTSKTTECVRVLLDRGNSKFINHMDGRGRSALHDAASLGLSDIVKELLTAGALVDPLTRNGHTPLHKAVRAKDWKSVSCLLKAGTDISTKDVFGESPLSMMLYSHQDILESTMNGCFTENKESRYINDSKIDIEFYPILHRKNTSQLEVLREIFLCGSIRLISHPLCEIFLLIQWLSLRKYFIIEVCIYFIFTILSSILILDKFIWMRVEGKFPDFVNGPVYSIFLFLVVIGAFLMLLRQCFIIVHGYKMRFISVWYILNCVIPILVLIVIPGEYRPWQDHLATITILFAWIQGMLHVGRFPQWGIYIAMFTSVSRNLMRIFMIFSCVFIAFALSFNIICFSNHIPAAEMYNTTARTTNMMSENDIVFTNIWLTLIKTLTMMTGELNFDADLIHVLNYLPGTSHLIFISFIFLMTILLSNLLVALAVSDVQGLRGKARIEKLFKQAELAELMETTCEVISKILKTLGLKKLSTKIHLPSLIGEDSEVYISSNDHYKIGSLLIRKNKQDLKIVPLKATFLEEVKKCLPCGDKEEKNTAIVADTLIQIKAGIQRIHEKFTELELKLSKLEVLQTHNLSQHS